MSRRISVVLIADRLSAPLGVDAGEFLDLPAAESRAPDRPETARAGPERSAGPAGGPETGQGLRDPSAAGTGAQGPDVQAPSAQGPGADMTMPAGTELAGTVEAGESRAGRIGAAALAGGWPLRPQGTPEAAGQALGLRRRRGALPALLWCAGADCGWLARALRAAGFSEITIHPVTGADPAPLEAALRCAGLSPERGPELAPGPGALRNARIQAALPGLAARLASGGRPFETRALETAAGRAAQGLPAPWPETPEAFEAALLARLGAVDLLPHPGFDPVAEGPAGLTGRRVSFVIGKLAGRSGGAERVLIETANALARRGHEVEILSHELRGIPPFYPVAPGVRLANLQPRREMRSRLRRLLDMARTVLERRLPDVFPFDRLVWVSRHGGFSRRLRAHLAATRPEAVIAFMPPAVTALALAGPQAGMLRIATMHNAPEQDFLNLERWAPSRYDQRRRLGLMARMETICVLLEEYRDWYPEPLRSKVLVVPNAVTPLDPDQLAAARRGNVVLAVGRLAPVKRHALLIASWERIARQFPDWQLHIYGEGPLREALEAQIRAAGLEEQVRLMGHASDITRAYLSAAVLAHPAEYEGFPLAVTEALAAGLPVLGFADCSGLNRLVADGVNGRLVPAPPAAPAGALPGAVSGALSGGRSDPDPDTGSGPEAGLRRGIDSPAARSTAAPAPGPATGGEMPPETELRTEGFARALAALMHDAGARAALSAAAPASMRRYGPGPVIDRWEDIAGIADPNRTSDRTAGPDVGPGAGPDSGPVPGSASGQNSGPESGPESGGEAEPAGTPQCPQDKDPERTGDIARLPAGSEAGHGPGSGARGTAGPEADGQDAAAGHG